MPPTDLNAVLRLDVPVIVRLGERQMTTREVLALAPGSIIELPKGADEPLDLMVNNRAIGLGVAVKIGENFGIRITMVGDAKARIEAMGAAASEASQPRIPEQEPAGQL
ncbi:MAG: FliM/FliN family flagellar motor C-terminal domain-containing protein [Phycisphaerales bacterium]